jgi:serine/threonine protein kinase
VGVIAYECIMGRRPYLGRSRKEIRDAILNKQAQIKMKDIPRGYSKEAADFVNRCLIRQPAHRLGMHGSFEVKSHPWFKSFDWESLKKKTMKPSYIPDNLK